MTSIEYQSEPFTKMAENDTSQLQRAIFAQYIMMKKLFMELEVEREASATAASAAMSMIQKLQKEKDAERMEAWQYKRIAEEKIKHTNRALEILKEVMELKELEISYLRNQLQVYKHKLSDAGIDDSDIADETIDSDKSLFGSKNMENLCHKIKRNFSLPTLQLNKLYTDMDMKKNSGIQSARSRLSDDSWEQISRNVMPFEPKESFSTDLDGRGKHGEEPHSPSNGVLHDSQTSDEPPCSSSFSVVSHQARENMECTVNHDQLKDSCVGDSRTLDEPLCSSSLSLVSYQADICSDGAVQAREDMECTVNHGQLKDSCVRDSQTLDEPPCSSSCSVVSHQADICSDGAVQAREGMECTVNHDKLKDSCVGTEMGEPVVHPLSDPLQIPERSNTTTDSSCTESEIMTEESQLSPTVVTKGRGPRNLSRFAATRKIGSMNNVDRHVRRSSGTYTPRAGVERTRSRLKRVQSEKMVELSDPRTNKEQIIMLKEVYEQLGMIESHMRPSDSQESPRNDTSLDSVMEAALSFSI
ncbi:uncharacterized protein LOC8077855 [Sorghum bicolor]|uniref:GTD-binding domain-containing protein n=1 Tax=Sorghum bicolor TaxID=4558 RepID=A0A1Z5R9X0_SORBI|nr:uncharacterized protein LOC8077855 [Sorghum bicolor]XP_021320997.1 uncharacterized protein LOC8077855 [Sorghum bicolor]XP_021320998.1 uncharacterized protein LOC8077855 [Sorghum bicolor]OQU80548.1 hypothetical protein SORBI_3007G142600 [Sorghum bicolor]|eukprot:XP_021320996.1 uncharacterized protein LOC8077855 [Sorghum bicolor]